MVSLNFELICYSNGEQRLIFEISNEVVEIIIQMSKIKLFGGMPCNFFFFQI